MKKLLSTSELFSLFIIFFFFPLKSAQMSGFFAYKTKGA